jgi:Secretion system C-terminal sorting domain
MKKIISLLILLFLANNLLAQDPAYPPAPPAPTNIIRLEYFFDTDPGFGNATAISITNGLLDVSGTYSVSLSGLTNGVHRLYIRSKAANGTWSLVSFKEFFIDYDPAYPTAPAAAVNIVQQEYFFDTDPGFGNGINITPNPNALIVSGTYAFNIAGLSNGVHRVYVRSKDANGKWSLTQVNDFTIDYNPAYPTAPPAAVNMAAQEYFIDTDPGFGNATPISTATGLQNVSGTYNVNVSGLAAGIHRIYFRTRDVNGKWSLTAVSQFTVDADPAYPTAPTAATNIIAAEYFIDTDLGFGNCTAIPLSQALDVTISNTPINVSGLSVGQHKLYVRTRTATKWSLTNVTSFNVEAAGCNSTEDTWTGASTTTPTNWNDGTNWCTGNVPTATKSVIIPAGLTNYPLINGVTVQCKTLTIATGVTIQTLGSGNIVVNENLVNNGTITGSVTLGGAAAQTASGTGKIDYLTLNNINGATITSGAGNAVTIANTLTIQAGTLTTNGNLTLQSTASNTARVAAITTGSISGVVNVQRYIPGGRRAFRYFSHPFTSNIALNQLSGAGEIDITGTGGSSNGFTTTVTNNPSGFWYDVVNGNASLSADPGWTAYTNATTATGSNAFKQYQGIRLLVRGTKGEGLTGGVYTPSAATYTVSGSINQGNASIPLTKGTNSGFNLVGNPYASQLDIKPALVAATNINGQNIWVWDAGEGTRGAYVPIKFTGTGAVSEYILPSAAAFFVDVTANTNLNFTESHKSSNTPNDLFSRTTGIDNKLVLSLHTDSIRWDRLWIYFNDKATPARDKEDALKLINSDVSLYSLSSDKQQLSIDVRKLETATTIPLGLQATATNNFTFKVAELQIEQGIELYLQDKWLNKEVKIDAAMQYNFTTTADVNSYGENRFAIVQKQTPLFALQSSELSIKLTPNPASNFVNIYYALPKADEATIRLIGAKGEVIQNISMGKQETGTKQINISNLATGVYTVQLTTPTETVSKQFVKE